MKDLNDLMPKIPNMRWGAVTNFTPTNEKIKELDRMLPSYRKWHSIIESPGMVDVDGVIIRRKTRESMT